MRAAAPPGSRAWWLLALAASCGAGLWLAGPIRQDPGYHRFADTREILGLPNFFNVVSNLPFAWFGAQASLFLLSARHRAAFADSRERWAYMVFFAGVFFTAFGSAYYHIEPDNLSLFWDRLPMALAFAGIFSAVISDRIGPVLGRRLLPPLVLCALCGLLFWRFPSDSPPGDGDLRAYAFTQYFPLVGIPWICWRFPARYSRGADLLAAAAWYGIAKAFEASDAALFSLGGVLSGHSLKHLAAALAVSRVLRMLESRSPVTRSVPR